MNQPKHHARLGSQGRKLLPTHARPSRPPPLKRGSSYNHAHSHSQGSSGGKVGPGWSKKLGADVGLAKSDEEGEDMASFLQFCATCERQLVTPGTSILYCSEACRKKDNAQQLSHYTRHSPPFTPSTPSYYDTRGVPDILPQRSPTVLRPVSLTFSDLTISDADSLIESEYAAEDIEAIISTTAFHSGSWSGESKLTRRSQVYDRSYTATGSSNMPSLSHTPSSSVDTVASAILQRPLPSRHKSHTSGSSNWADLVVPIPTASPSSPTLTLKDASLKSTASTGTAFRVAEGENVSYERRPASRKASDAHSSLQQLFSHAAMTAPPAKRPTSSRLG